MSASLERDSFSGRLRAALDQAGWRALGATGLAREFNQRSPSVRITAHAARKWLQGEAIPAQDKLRVLADWLQVPIDWLRFGGAEKPAPAVARHVAEQTLARHTPGHMEKLASDFARLDAEQQRVVEDLIGLLLRTLPAGR